MEIKEILSQLNSKLVSNIATLKMTDLVRQNNQLTEAFVGKVTEVGFIETTLPLTNEQKIKIGDIEIVRAVGDTALSYSIAFESGESIAISTLLRSNKSKIGNKAAKAHTPEELLSLVGKTLTLQSVTQDPSTLRKNRIVENGVTVERDNIGKAYVFTVA